MKLVQRPNKSDGYEWQCRRRRADQDHHVVRSLRKGTWFEDSKLTLEELVLLTYFWVEEYAQINVKKELEMSPNTILDWYSFCREVCMEILHDTKKIGGPGHVVQLDEAEFCTKKYNRAKRVEGQWVFGGVDLKTGDCFLNTVEDRSADTLLRVLKERVLPGTTIYSDCWKAYDCLKMEGFQHLAVNHSIIFKDKDTGYHTNSIEEMCHLMKERTPACDGDRLLLDSYLAEFMYRRMRCDPQHRYITFMQDIARVYPPKEKD
jgi:transposase-like protein